MYKYQEKNVIKIFVAKVHDTLAEGQNISLGGDILIAKRSKYFSICWPFTCNILLSFNSLFLHISNLIKTEFDLSTLPHQKPGLREAKIQKYR